MVAKSVLYLTLHLLKEWWALADESNQCPVPSMEAVETLFTVFAVSQPGIAPATYQFQSEFSTTRPLQDYMTTEILCLSL